MIKIMDGIRKKCPACGSYAKVIYWAVNFLNCPMQYAIRCSDSKCSSDKVLMTEFYSHLSEAKIAWLRICQAWEHKNKGEKK